MPTPNVRLDIWDHVESYGILMFLACRLKITFTSNLKHIISFLVLHIVLLSLRKVLSLVASTRHAPLTSRVYLRLADRPSVHFANSTYKNNLQVTGTGTAFLSSQGIVLVAQVSIVGYLEQEPPLFFSIQFSQCEKPRELLPTSYVQGPNSNGSSTKYCIPLSSN